MSIFTRREEKESLVRRTLMVVNSLIGTSLSVSRDRSTGKYSINGKFVEQSRLFLHSSGQCLTGLLSARIFQISMLYCTRKLMKRKNNHCIYLSKEMCKDEIRKKLQHFIGKAHNEKTLQAIRLKAKKFMDRILVHDVEVK